MSTTIFALSTGVLPSAVAVFRLSGPHSLRALQEVTGKKIWTPRQLKYSKILTEEGKVLDHAMTVHMPGPSTFTGEDCSEIHIHGSVAVANALTRRLSSIPELRQARRGEFTKRAFFNGKMDYSEVCGLQSLISAKTERQRQLAFHKSEGGQEIRKIRDQLTEISIHLYAQMDFGEHVEISKQEIRIMIEKLLVDIRSMTERSRRAMVVEQGIRAVLIGRPNSGKSTILNALAKKDMAIVSPVAGTTRDCVESTITINGVPVTFTDTAGIHDSNDEIELEGIRRSKEKIREADLALIITTAGSDVAETNQMLEEIKTARSSSIPVIIVRNKSDLVQNSTKADIKHPDVISLLDTCAIQQNGISKLFEILETELEKMLPSEEGPLISDHHIAEKLEHLLEECLLLDDVALILHRIEESLSQVGQLTGDTVNEQILDQLFNKFCVGK